MASPPGQRSTWWKKSKRRLSQFLGKGRKRKPSRGGKDSPSPSPRLLRSPSSSIVAASMADADSEAATCELASYVPSLVLSRAQHETIGPGSADVYEVPAAALMLDVSGFVRMCAELAERTHEVASPKRPDKALPPPPPGQRTNLRASMPAMDLSRMAEKANAKKKWFGRDKSGSTSPQSPPPPPPPPPGSSAPPPSRAGRGLGRSGSVEIRGSHAARAASPPAPPQLRPLTGTRESTGSLKRPTLDPFRFENQDEEAGYASEMVQRMLQYMFGGMIEIVLKYGGDVLRVAGDALIVIMPCADGADDKDAYADAVARATLCADECIKFKWEWNKKRLQVHAGVACGKVACFNVGGVRNHWQLVPSGLPVEQMGEALDVSAAGQLVVEQSAWDCVKNRGFLGKPIGADTALQYKHVLVTETSLAQMKHASSHRQHGARRKLELEWWNASSPAHALEALRAYSPEAVLHGGSSAGYSMGGMAVEGIRLMSCVFINIDFNIAQASTAALEKLNNIFREVQRGVYSLAGTIKELTADDKGLVCVAGFGILPFEAMGSAEAATIASAYIERALAGLGVSCAIGISTGSVFSTSIGNEERCEFAMVSNSMNMAARLMKSVDKVEKQDKDGDPSLVAEDAKKSRKLHRTATNRSAELDFELVAERVVVDEKTRDDCARSLHIFFGSLKPIKVKGRDDKLPVFQPHLAEEPSSIMFKISHPGTAVTPDGLANALGQETTADSTADAVEAQSDTRIDAEAMASMESGHDAEFSNEMIPTQHSGHRSDELHYSALATLAPAFFGTQDVQDLIIDLLWVRTGGNPLYIRELVLHIHESGCGELYLDGWYLNDATFGTVLGIASTVPHALNGHLLARLEALSPIHQLVVRMIACVGGRAPIGLVRHLLETVEPLSAYWEKLKATFERVYSGELARQRSSSASDIEFDTLRVALKGLKEVGFSYDSHFTVVSCSDFMFVDFVGHAIPFNVRRSVHRAASQWYIDSKVEIEERMQQLPTVINHHCESGRMGRASALLTLLKQLGGHFIDDWVLTEVRTRLPFNCGDRGSVGDKLRALACLAGVPHLRGLAKSMEQFKVEKGVVSAAVKFREKAISRIQQNWKKRRASMGPVPSAADMKMAILEGKRNSATCSPTNLDSMVGEKLFQRASFKRSLTETSLGNSAELGSDATGTTDKDSAAELSAEPSADEVES